MDQTLIDQKLLKNKCPICQQKLRGTIADWTRHQELHKEMPFSFVGFQMLVDAPQNPAKIFRP